jgi:hypothetical protein
MDESSYDVCSRGREVSAHLQSMYIYSSITDNNHPRKASSHSCTFNIQYRLDVSFEQQSRPCTVSQSAEYYKGTARTRFVFKPFDILVVVCGVDCCQLASHSNAWR